MTARRITAAQADAIAERVYLAQERRQGERAPKPWAELGRDDRWPWRDGAMIYLRAALAIGWRAPMKTKRPR